MGAKAVLVLRLGKIILVNDGLISGELISSNFYGGSTLLFIDCGLRQLIKVASALEQAPSVGTICHLTWDPSDALVLADD